MRGDLVVTQLCSQSVAEQLSIWFVTASGWLQVACAAAVQSKISQVPSCSSYLDQTGGSN